MLPDIHILDLGDMTEIGEKGINLSGGQKQRLGLARAVYSDRDIYILDDPLSAVDVRVGKHIFEKVIDSRTGILKEKTRLLVTHSLDHLKQADRILLIEEGKVVEEVDSYASLINAEKELKKCLLTESSKQKHLKDEEDPHDECFFKDKKTRNHLMTEETVATKSIDSSVYLYYAREIGWKVVISSLALVLAEQSLSILATFWLANWSNDPHSSKPRLRNMYLAMYGILGVGGTLVFAPFTLLITLSGVKASSCFHSKMLDSVLRAPMEFFETNPKGRILNRFSKDVDAVEWTLPWTFGILLRQDVFFGTN